MEKEFENFLILKNYAKSSISGYLSILNIILKEQHSIFEKPKKEIICYLANKIKAQNISAGYVAQFVSVINIVRLNILGIEDTVKIPAPNKPVNQPDVLSLLEVESMINNTENIKHKAIIALMYATGMRSNEVCNVKLSDIDSKANLIKIKQGKGMKDRVAMLDESLLSLLKEYYLVYKPNVYLFNGATGKRYSERSVQNIVKAASVKNNIDKKISSHSMRHSCFTQLVKNGVDIRYIQKLAGHKNINTTAKYLQINDVDVLSIKSPLAEIKIKK